MHPCIPSPTGPGPQPISHCLPMPCWHALHPPDPPSPHPPLQLPQLLYGPCPGAHYQAAQGGSGGGPGGGIGGQNGLTTLLGCELPCSPSLHYLYLSITCCSL